MCVDPSDTAAAQPTDTDELHHLRMRHRAGAFDPGVRLKQGTSLARVSHQELALNEVMWQSFEHDRAGALGLDGLASTHPIYAPVRSVAQATENFDLITYEKGAAVVRMIEQYLGADAFRDGVRRYMPETPRESSGSRGARC